jgi:hypothetical protein
LLLAFIQALAYAKRPDRAQAIHRLPFGLAVAAFTLQVANSNTLIIAVCSSLAIYLRCACRTLLAYRRRSPPSGGDVQPVRPADTTKLIVDARRNNGGDEDSVRVVAASLIAFRVERPQAQVFVLISPNTLAAAQNFVSTLDQWMHVEFAGEVTGSRPKHVGDDTLVVSPYSGLMGSIACALHQTTFSDKRPWIAPALPVSLSSQDYFGQRDPVLEAVLHQIGLGPRRAGLALAHRQRRALTTPCTRPPASSPAPRPACTGRLARTAACSPPRR